MLKKISEFIVDKRIPILAIMLVLAIVGLICSGFVGINKDMTKYLPDSSNMKAGMDIMNNAFPEMKNPNSIRVMFDNLTDSDKEIILEKLQGIAYVDSVDHDPDSADYNKANHTLFVINMSCDYGSAEEKAIESALSSEFAGYTVVWQNDSTDSPGIPGIVILFVMIILFAVLFAMCGSWLEPFLFLATIGIAIVINAGTNLFMGEIADVTQSIAALLQMVLSMDYSIIMMNRYRQERQLEADKTTAMKNAWVNAFSSVASSSLTTVVGLLMLVFMSFKIGTDLGVVLAKGVFISMICVLTILPALIVLCDELLTKTAKKVLHIPMNWAAKFAHKSRFVLTGIFLFLFITFCILQAFTGINYTLEKEDAVAEVFPKDNMVVMVYDSRDENNLGSLVDYLNQNDKVSSVMGYSTTLGQPHTADKLLNAMGEFSDDVKLDPVMLDLLYYHYYTGGQVGTMTPSDFLSFITDTVVNNDAFSDYISGDMMDNVDLLRKFADPEALQKPMSANELAEIFQIDEANIQDLFLLYQLENPAAATGGMTLATFANFIVGDIAQDPTYNAMFDEETLGQLTQLVTFTNAEIASTPYLYQEIAALLGMEADQVKLLFIYYHALSNTFDPGTMTLPEFVSFLKNDVANDPVFSTYIDPVMLVQIDTLASFSSKTTLLTQQTPASMAALLEIDETMAKTIFILHNAQDVSYRNMTLTQFIDFINGTLLSNPMFAGSFDEATRVRIQSMNYLVRLAASNQSLSTAQMAEALEMDEDLLKQLYYLYYSNNTEFQQEVAATKMTLHACLSLLKANATAEQQAQLAQVEQLIGAAMSETALTATELAAITGMAEADITLILEAQGVEKMSLVAFLDTATATDPENTQLQQLVQLISLATSRDELDTATLATALSVEQSQIHQLIGLKLASEKSIPLASFTEFLVNNVVRNQAFSSNFTEEQVSQLSSLNLLANLASNNTSLDTEAFANLFGMEESLVTIIFRLYFGNDISHKTMTLENAIDFILEDPVMKDYMANDNWGQLQMMQKIIKATVNDIPFIPATLAQFLDMDSNSLNMLFAIHASGKQLSTWTLSVETIVDFLVSNKSSLASMMDPIQLESLTTAQTLIQAAASGTYYTAEQISVLTGMTPEQARQLYLLYTDKYGDTSNWHLSVKDFISFINNSVLTNESYADQLDDRTVAMLPATEKMVDTVIANAEHTPAEMADIFSSLTNELDTTSVELMYLYSDSLKNADPTRTMTLEGLFNYLVSNILEDPRFASVIDEDMRTNLLKNKQALENGKLQLTGEQYSRLVITTKYKEESPETTAFINGIQAYAKNNLEGDIYLIGNSPMNCEMQQIFDKELILITLLTALAIFLIVALAFRSLSIPLILVLLVQCGVYITVSVTGVISGGMHFLALLIVECILMGATIDYGILFTNYYCECRKTDDVKEALKQAYAGSIHTIMTSGLILVLVTALVGGLFEEATVSAIVRTLSIGSFCAIMLILFVLPGILATCDKLVIKKVKENNDKNIFVDDDESIVENAVENIEEDTFENIEENIGKYVDAYLGEAVSNPTAEYTDDNILEYIDDYINKYITNNETDDQK